MRGRFVFSLAVRRCLALSPTPQELGVQGNRQGVGQDGTAQVELWRQRADLCRGHGDELGEAALNVGLRAALPR